MILMWTAALITALSLCISSDAFKAQVIYEPIRNLAACGLVTVMEKVEKPSSFDPWPF